MKVYDHKNPEEDESYLQYKKRKFHWWEMSLRGIIMDIKESSLRSTDKKKIISNLIKKLTIK